MTEEEIQERVDQAIQTAEKFTDIFYKYEKYTDSILLQQVD
jgi:hypothetical protein